MRPTRVALTAACAVFAGAQTAAAETPGDGFDVQGYALALRPDLQTGSVSATQTITLRSTTAALTRIAFSPNALTIADVTIDGQPARAASDAEAIVFTAPRPIARGRTATLRFRLSGAPKRGVSVIPQGLYTSYFACDWMVCLQNAPGDKADFALDLLVPPGLQSLGVGRPARVTREGDLERHRWRSTRAYSSYLYAFAVGRFARRTDRSPAGELIAFDGAAAGGRLPDLFVRAPAIAAFLADKAGMPLPDRRYIQLLVPGGEAQESASFSLIGRDDLEEDAARPDREWIVAHEMAHQWWGNLVTCQSWRDFWLNEGVATFMVAAWHEHARGAAAYQAELDVARRNVERVRAEGFDKPLAWSGAYPSLGARRAVQYSKGALFLAHLRGEIGDTAFWAGLRAYTRTHAGGTVTSKDFQSAMETASGRDLGALFNEWVYGAPGV